MVETHIDVWQPEELRTLCHSSGVSFPCGLSKNWRAFRMKKKQKKFSSCQIKQRVSGVKESNHWMYEWSVRCKLGSFGNFFLLIACLLWPALGEPQLMVNIVLGVFSVFWQVFCLVYKMISIYRFPYTLIYLVFLRGKMFHWNRTL